MKLTTSKFDRKVRLRCETLYVIAVKTQFEGSRHGAACIHHGLADRNCGSVTHRASEFLFSKMSNCALGPILLPIQRRSMVFPRDKAAKA